MRLLALLIFLCACGPPSGVDNFKGEFSGGVEILTLSVFGVDTSHWQGPVNFDSLRAQNASFIIAKATEGDSIVDDQFARSRRLAPDAGIIFGAYHFFRAQADPRAQLENYLREVGPVRSGELPPALDVEEFNGYSPKEFVARADLMLEGLERNLGVTPMIYSDIGFLEQLRPYILHWSKYPLWIAHPGSHSPHPPPYPWQIWTFWQYSQNGMDWNAFNGSMEQLQKLAKP